MAAVPGHDIVEQALPMVAGAASSVLHETLGVVSSSLSLSLSLSLYLSLPTPPIPALVAVPSGARASCLGCMRKIAKMGIMVDLEGNVPSSFFTFG
jgi:hypothetical protein